MLETKETISPDKKKSKSILSIRAMLRYMRKFFLPWIISSAIAALVIVGGYTITTFSDQILTVNVNFSFDGVESGHDPLGNKFDVNEIKSESAVQSAVKELGIENPDVEAICDSISISGNIPSNAIERISNYTSIYSSNEISLLKDINDTTYYPTQYIINMNCSELDMSFNECADFLNLLTSNYKQAFAAKYGYKDSLANAVISLDYNEYDYNEIIDVFDSSLRSLQSYITELATTDNVRFRSEQTGYTFADLAKSIETIRNENLDIISSYITLYNMTKDKDHLIVNYEYRVDEYERQKKIFEEKYESIKQTLEIYEKNSILIFAQATAGTDAALNQSSDTYDNLIQMEINAEKSISEYEQQIEKYNKRIKKLKENSKKGSVEKLEEDFQQLDSKIKNLLETVEITVSEYYNDIIFLNAYEILSPASASYFDIFLTAVDQSFFNCAATELLILAAYIFASLIATSPRANEYFSAKYNALRSIRKTDKKEKNKKNKSKGGRK